MESKKLDEIQTWWVEINKLEGKGKAVDLLSFADAAHEYIPILLAELERLRHTRDAVSAPAGVAQATPAGEGIRATPRLSASVTASGFQARSTGSRVSALAAERSAS
jgi:hypothetical protein